MSVTAKGRRWEILHSLWIGWTFTLGFFNWVAFLYIGIRAKQRKWLLWGMFYSIPFIFAMLTPNSVSWLWNVIVALTLLLGGVGIAHAFRIRNEYLLRLESLQQGKSRKEVMLKQQLSGSVKREEVSQQDTVTLEKTNIATSRHNSTRPAASREGSAHPSPSAASTNQTTDAVDTPAQPAVLSPGMKPISHKLQPGKELDYRITSSYPFPIAFGFRSLMSIVDYRDLYREQLRIAENILAFLASVSLTQLREQDRQKAEIDLKENWRSGISPGDWKDIVGRCSKVFPTYEGNLLALEIARLNIRSEKKGFGQDVAGWARLCEHSRSPQLQPHQDEPAIRGESS
jgi:hypothetical protein